MKIKVIWIALIFFSYYSPSAFSQAIYAGDLTELLDDLDSDGVINARDVCENTQFGKKVENNGCPTIYLKHFFFNFDVQFETNEYQLDPQFYSTLEGLAQFLQDYPDTLVLVEGYTDNKGSKRQNLTLSEKRAESIANTLTSVFGVHPNRIKAFGFGQDNPLESNETEEGRKKNRRVTGEIIQPLLPPEANQITGSYNTFSLPFPLNQYTSQQDHYLILEKLGEFLAENPESFAFIEGHTDNTGDENFNLALSKKRANEIAEVLNTQFFIPKDRLKIIGYGIQEPIAANDNEKGRQKNRRVDITIGHRFTVQKEVLLPKWTIWNLGKDSPTVPKF